MTKEEVAMRLCVVARRVADERFGFNLAADCFCGKNGFVVQDEDYRFDEGVMRFVEQAVNRALRQYAKRRGGK